MRLRAFGPIQAGGSPNKQSHRTMQSATGVISAIFRQSRSSERNHFMGNVRDGLPNVVRYFRVFPDEKPKITPTTAKRKPRAPTAFCNSSPLMWIEV